MGRGLWGGGAGEERLVEVEAGRVGREGGQLGLEGLEGEDGGPEAAGERSGHAQIALVVAAPAEDRA